MLELQVLRVVSKLPHEAGLVLIVLCQPLVFVTFMVNQLEVATHQKRESAGLETMAGSPPLIQAGSMIRPRSFATKRQGRLLLPYLASRLKNCFISCHELRTRSCRERAGAEE